MLVTEYVTIPLKGMNIKRYESIGYVIPKQVNKQGKLRNNLSASLLVKSKDLTRGSEVRVDVQCDYCGSVKSMQYKNYVIQQEKDIVEKDSCVKCKGKKISESNLRTYGVSNVMQLDDIRQKQNNSNRNDIDIVKSDFIRMGFIPLFETYTTRKDKLLCICENHLDVIQEKTYDSIKAEEGCVYCFYESIRGENHHNWNDGITNLRVYIHNTKSIKMWKQDSLEYYGHRCLKTKSNLDLQVHHAVKGFSEILNEALDVLELDIRQNIKEYTYDELHSIEMKCLQLHYWYGFGYPLTKQSHIEFHKTYGYKGFSYNDFNKFIYGYCDWDYENGSIFGLA